MKHLSITNKNKEICEVQGTESERFTGIFLRFAGVRGSKHTRSNTKRFIDSDVCLHSMNQHAASLLNNEAASVILKGQYISCHSTVHNNRKQICGLLVPGGSTAFV